MLLSAQPGRESSIQVTNDGATILRSIGVDNPVAKILIGKLNHLTLFTASCSLQVIISLKLRNLYAFYPCRSFEGTR